MKDLFGSLKESLFYDAIVKSTDNYIYVVDMQTDEAQISPNMLEDFELPGLTFKGLVPLWGELVHERDRERYFESLDIMLQGKTDEHNVEYQVRNRKDEYIWVHCRGRLQRDSRGTMLMFAGMVTNLGNKGKVDYTTGLFNHRECEKQINSLLEQGRCRGGFMLLGFDDFTRINNLNSHVFGDEVLRQFAQGTQRMLPPDASMYRYDSDEFAIICPGATEQEMNTLYGKIHAFANRSHQIDDKEYYCTVSAGIVMMGPEKSSYPELLKSAASALDVSKGKGKNTATVYSPEILEARVRAMMLTEQLRFCVMNGMDRFRLVYQPFVDSENLKLTGAEALLRWSCESLGEISPVEFIPLLESSGLIVPVGKWVLEQAVRTCKRWSKLQDDFVMNINISYLQMMEDSFVPFVRQTLEDYQLSPEHIVLELTESCFVTDMEALRDVFCNLRGINIKIAMDDFGTGYSSLGMLSQTPADIVKIDRLFITAISDSKNAFNRSFIDSVIQLCHSVGISVCVEGVEQQEELHTVCTLKADKVQGYIISRPISVDDFEQKYWGGTECVN